MRATGSVQSDVSRISNLHTRVWEVRVRSVLDTKIAKKVTLFIQVLHLLVLRPLLPYSWDSFPEPIPNVLPPPS